MRRTLRSALGIKTNTKEMSKAQLSRWEDCEIAYRSMVRNPTMYIEEAVTTLLKHALILNKDIPRRFMKPIYEGGVPSLRQQRAYAYEAMYIPPHRILGRVLKLHFNISPALTIRPSWKFCGLETSEGFGEAVTWDDMLSIITKEEGVRPKKLLSWAETHTNLSFVKNMVKKNAKKVK